MIKVKVKKTGNTIEAIINKLRQLDKHKAQAGYFESAGIHSGSNMPYTDLMAIHEFGIKVPPRPLMMITALHSEADIRIITSRYLQDYLMGRLDGKTFLQRYSNAIYNNAMSIFGNPSYLTSNADYTIQLKGANTPLVDTEELRDAFEAKNTWG